MPAPSTPPNVKYTPGSPIPVLHWRSVAKVVGAALVVAASVLIMSPRTAATASDGPTTAVTNGNGYSYASAMSADGRYSAFFSTATDLAPGVTSGNENVYLWDRATATTTTVTNGNGHSFYPTMTPDGRYIAFRSFATDLVPGGTSGDSNVFVWERTTGTTTAVSSGGLGDSSISTMSEDGRYILFVSPATDLVPGVTSGNYNVYQWDRTTGTTTAITNGNGFSGGGSISADNRSIVFNSAATNLVPGVTSGNSNVYRWDRTTGTTTAITNGNGLSVFPATSADGRFITFESEATNLVNGGTSNHRNIFQRDRTTGTTTAITNGNDISTATITTADGRYTTFRSAATDLVPNQSGGDYNVLLWDRTTGTTAAITKGSTAEPVAISPDGRYIAFSQFGGDQEQVSRWDRASGTTVAITNGNGGSDPVAMSSDGRYVSFTSYATNLVQDVNSGERNVFLGEGPLPPAAPTAVNAAAGNAQASVSWTAPRSGSDEPVTGYVVTPYIGTTAQPVRRFHDTLTKHTLTALTTGTTYTFKVAAIDAVGTGQQSASSNAVKPK